jgi:ACS family D-galactonate transporter-like MFS transporter
MVNSLDRAIIGIASPAIAREFTLSPIAMGLIFSAFSWSYFAAQLPGGLALDRFGARIVYLVSIAGWSLSTLLHATANGFAALFGWRLSLGLFEAPCFPANNNIVGAWFPRAERARAIGVYTSAEYVALGFAAPLLLWLQDAHGWRALFIVSGG